MSKQSKDSLGDRMKKYEGVSRSSLLSRTPVIVRVDGRAFHTYTRGMEKPYDRSLQDAMAYAAFNVAKEMAGFKIGYTQSDEVSFLLTDWDNVETKPWFDNDQQKIASIAASLMTAHFNQYMGTLGVKKIGAFDGRVFNLPMGPEIVNYFLWRAKDWERNSLSMFARTYYSSKELHGKKKQDMHDMLHAKGKNWAKDVDARSRNGTFFYRTDSSAGQAFLQPEYAAISSLISQFIGVDLTPKTLVAA